MTTDTRDWMVHAEIAQMLDEDEAFELMERLVARGPSISLDESGFEVTLTGYGATAPDADADVRAALAGVGIHGEVTRLDVSQYEDD